MSRRSNQTLQRWHGRWQALAPRERLGLGLAASALTLGLLWIWGLAPALHTLRTAPARHAALDAQLADMQRLAAQAQHLRASGDSAARLPRAESLAALEQANARLPQAPQLSVQGNRAQVSLASTDAEDLARWLADVRLNARLLPLELNLKADPQRPRHWLGSVGLSGPALAP